MDQKEWKEKKFGSQFATGGSGLFFFSFLEIIFNNILHSWKSAWNHFSKNTYNTLQKTKNQKTKNWDTV